MVRRTARSAARTREPKRRPGRTVVLVATRKGAWLFHGDAARRTWRADGPHFLGHNVSHLVLDPRDGKTLLAAAKTGHLGPDDLPLHRLRARPGRKPRGRRRSRRPRRARRDARSTTPSGSRPAARPSRDVWYAGTSPQGLFRSEDGGVTWEPFSGINDDPQFREWMGTAQDGTPDGPKLHSIIVDPARRRASLHRDVGRRRARVAGRRPDLEDADQGHGGGRGIRLRPGQAHVPRSALRRMCPTNPDRLYQQNHCGIYRLDRPSDTWARVGRSMPKRGRRHRLPDGGAPARCRHRVGVPDGRHAGLAAHQPRRQARGLRHAQRRRDLAAARRRPARGARPGGR